VYPIQTRATQNVAYPLAVKPLKSSKFNCNLDVWPWKSIGCQIFVSITWVPCLVEIHWTMLTLECSQEMLRKDGQMHGRTDSSVTISPSQLCWRGDNYVHSLVKIHWRMLILEYSQGCYGVKIWPCDIDLWPGKSIGFQILLRTRHVPSLVKIHWRMLILVFTRM
jgi:hypothetical protein